MHTDSEGVQGLVLTKIENEIFGNWLKTGSGLSESVVVATVWQLFVSKLIVRLAMVCQQAR